MKRGIAQRGLNASDEMGSEEFGFCACSFRTIIEGPTAYAPYLRCISLIRKGLAKRKCTYVVKTPKVKHETNSYIQALVIARNERILFVFM